MRATVKPGACASMSATAAIPIASSCDAKVCAVEDGTFGDNFIGKAKHDHEQE